MRHALSIFSLVYWAIKAWLIITLLQWLVGTSFAAPKHRILTIGDSQMVGPFGSNLDKGLRKLSDTSLELYGSCGSIAKWWVTGKETTCGYYFSDKTGQVKSGTRAATPLYKPMLERIKPTLVIVELSGNYYGFQDDRYIIDDMRAMAKTIKEAGATCLWVSTPKTRKYAERILRLVPLVHKAVDDYCDVFESHHVTDYPATGGDGIHYSFAGGIPVAKKWAEHVVEKVKEMIGVTP